LAESLPRRFLFLETGGSFGASRPPVMLLVKADLTGILERIFTDESNKERRYDFIVMGATVEDYCRGRMGSIKLYD
jgi:hypothetical protein